MSRTSVLLVAAVSRSCRAPGSLRTVVVRSSCGERVGGTSVGHGARPVVHAPYARRRLGGTSRRPVRPRCVARPPEPDEGVWISFFENKFVIVIGVVHIGDI
jgi:hypothetical protein